MKAVKNTKDQDQGTGSYRDADHRYSGDQINGLRGPFAHQIPFGNMESQIHGTKLSNYRSVDNPLQDLMIDGSIDDLMNTLAVIIPVEEVNVGVGIGPVGKENKDEV